MNTSSSPRRRIHLDTIATVFFIVACTAATVWIVRDIVAGPARIAAATRVPSRTVRPPAPPEPPIPAEPISLDGAVLKGDAHAKVALIIYSDFQCPFCGRFAHDTWPALDSKYVGTGKVKVAFRQFPLEAIHPFALGAAEAAECAGNQGKFWPMHDLLFNNQKQLAANDLSGYADQLRLNRGAFESCMSASTIAKVRADAVSGAALGVTGTPAFLVGAIQPDGHVRVSARLVGARPTADFEAVIDKALAVPLSARK